MDKKTSVFIKKKFKEYYFKHIEEIEVPSRINEREFGYMTFDRIMIRHISFQNSGEMQARILKESPNSVYYSTSFYEEPSRPIHEKGWKGGDLTFDIDADTLSSPCRKDHDKWICRICGVQQVGVKPNKCPSCKGTRIHEINIACGTCLDDAKNEAIKLQDILINDFGIQRANIDTFFSGSMGYHLSIANSDFAEANQAVRSDIVDYISGQAFLPESLGVSRKSSYENMIDRFPSENEKGWRGRIARYFKDQQNREKPMDTPMILTELFRKAGYRKFRLAIEEAAKKSGAIVDPAVTTDIHRILRLPGTLHGKTGLLKKRCRNLENFSPLEDAVAFGRDPIKILIDNSPQFSLMEEQFGPFKSESIELPMMAAIYLLGQDMAKVAE